LIKIDNYNDVEFKEIPKDEECMTTAVKIGEIIEEPASRIRKWAEYHEDNLYIKKINGRFAYTQKSVEQFKFIKDLKQNKNMTHEQIRQHMQKHGMHYSKYDGGLIDPRDPFGYEALSSAISQKTQEQLKEFLTNFIQYQEQSNQNLVKAVTLEVEQTVQDLVEESISGIEKELESQKENNRILSQQLSIIQQELEVTQNINKKLEYKLESQSEQIKTNFNDMSEKIIKENSKMINDFKYVNLKKEQEPKGLFSKIFGKKN